MNVHLLASINQALLCRWDSFLLLDALLYPRDLIIVSLRHLLHTMLCESMCTVEYAGYEPCESRKVGRRWKVAYLVVRFDVELDLLTGEGSYSGGMSASIHTVVQSCSKLSSGWRT